MCQTIQSTSLVVDSCRNFLVDIHILQIKEMMQRRKKIRVTVFLNVVFLKDSAHKNIDVILTFPRVLVYDCSQDKD